LKNPEIYFFAQPFFIAGALRSRSFVDTFSCAYTFATTDGIGTADDGFGVGW
jgi:hypothetical protein